MGLEPFVNVTAEELIFGYDDTLVSLAHRFFPKHRRPMSRMGLLLGVRVYSFLSESQVQSFAIFFYNLQSQYEEDQRNSSEGSFIYCLFFILSGVRLSPLGTAGTIGLLYQPQMIDNGDCGATGGKKIGRENRSTRRKPTPVLLCQPQIPHGLTRARTRAAEPATNRQSYGAALHLLLVGWSVGSA
jgi:hypothetical protein